MAFVVAIMCGYDFGVWCADIFRLKRIAHAMLVNKRYMGRNDHTTHTNTCNLYMQPVADAKVIKLYYTKSSSIFCRQLNFPKIDYY